MSYRTEIKLWIPSSDKTVCIRLSLTLETSGNSTKSPAVCFCKEYGTDSNGIAFKSLICAIIPLPVHSCVIEQISFS